MGVSTQSGGFGAFNPQRQLAIYDLQSIYTRFCPRRQDGLASRQHSKQRPAEPGDPGHRVQLCRTGQMGKFARSSPGRARSCTENRAICFGTN